MRQKAIFFILVGFSALLITVAGNGDGAPDGVTESQIKKLPETGRVNAPARSAMLFEDEFESGTLAPWQPESGAIPNCNCYFSGDCKAGDFCFWGPGGPGTEDNCNWRLPKPQGLPGKGCYSDVGNPGPICDGYCTSTRVGSLFGHEPSWLVIEGIQLWAEAMLAPARQGGGPMDPVLAEQAMAMTFHKPFMPALLGRHVADILTLAGGLAFYDFYCHHENDMMTPEYYVDLTGNPCTASVSALLIEGLVAEIESPGSAAGYVAEIRKICPDWALRMPLRCMPGEEADVCLERQIAGFALYMSIPRDTTGGQ